MNPHDLIQAYLDDELTDGQFAQLSAWLAESEANREAFVQATNLDNNIRHELAQDDLSRFLDEVDISAVQDAMQRSHEDASDALLSIAHEHVTAKDANDELTLSRALGVLTRAGVDFAGQSLRRHAVPLCLAAAVALALAFVIAIAFIGSGEDPELPEIAGQMPTAPEVDKTDVVATITAQLNAKWAEGALAPGSRLSANQRLTLTAGFAEITTNRGAVALLEAPATFELLDRDNALRLHAGKMVGICHTPASKGFFVKTNHADITDLGTEFGVRVEPDLVEATVFVGEVQIKSAEGTAHRLAHNQTARLIVEDGNPSLMIEDRVADGFTRRTPRPALVSDVTLSVEGFEARVLPQGVYEDATLYTDRGHQINGIDEKGIPAFLIGGDLVQMPCDARPDLHPRVGNALTVELELAAPADIYLLIERGTKREPWLMQDYELMDQRVGNDHHTPSDGLSLGFGPGFSIDRHFEIWKRKAPASGRITAAGNIESTMYAIVVTPATETNLSRQP